MPSTHIKNMIIAYSVEIIFRVFYALIAAFYGKHC